MEAITNMIEMRNSTRKVKSTYGTGRRLDSGRIPPRGAEIKGKAWHDRHIKKKRFKEGDVILLYATNFCTISVSSKCIGWGHLK
jgi:hypothetical protein